MLVIDGTGLVLGRLGSFVAKKLLEGEDVVVLNAEKVVISGKAKVVVERYKRRRLMKDKANPEHSAHWPRRPDLLVRRAIRGMLPFGRKPHGISAFRKLRVYMGIPAEFAGSEKKSLESASADRLSGNKIDVRTLCNKLGWS